MKTTTPVDRYLAQVDSHLGLGRAERKRALEEIDGHLADAVDALIADGTAPDEAARRAIEEFGPPEVVALGFSDPAVEPRQASRRLRWFDWLPIALPSLQAALCLVLIVQSVARMVSDGAYGVQRGLEWAALYLLVSVGLTAGGWFLIRQGHRQRVPSPAWIVTALAVVLMVRW
jgi:hypothetical protein